MNEPRLMRGCALIALALTCAGCRTGPTGSSRPATPSEHPPLTAIRTRHRYIAPEELPEMQLRVALVDTRWRAATTTAMLSIGIYRPHDGLFRMEVGPLPCPTLDSLVKALDPYVDRMPVGLILTVDGQVAGTPGGATPPEAFTAYVGELQRVLEREGIEFAFLLPTELHRVK